MYILQIWIRHLIWATLLLTGLLAITLLLGGEDILVLTPLWASFALTLAAYPAGLWAGRELDGGRLPSLRWIVQVLFATLVASGVALALAGYVGPWMTRWLDGTAGGGGPLALSLSDVYSGARSAARVADAAATSDVDTWLHANKLIWQFTRTLAVPIQCFDFAWIGVFVGYWSRRVPRLELQQAQQWSMGLFLMISTYLAGDNSFEQIVEQAGGPIVFAGWLVLIVPTLMVGTLGWPTLIALWKGGR